MGPELPLKSAGRRSGEIRGVRQDARGMRGVWRQWGVGEEDEKPKRVDGWP